MDEPEVESLVALGLGSLKIRQLLRCRHLLPLLVLALVPPDVVLLDRQVHSDVVSSNRHQDFVASSCKISQRQQTSPQYFLHATNATRTDRQDLR
jgi:hypothetical protein